MSGGRLAGPQHAELEGGRLALPSHGWAMIEGEGVAVTLDVEAEPGSSVQHGKGH